MLHTALFSGAALIAGNPGSHGSLVLTLCLYTLFVALLSLGLIPGLNRKGTYQMDRWIFYKQVDADIITEAIEKSRHLQDDPGYPLPSMMKASPSIADRRQQQSTGKDIKGAWHMASMWYFYGLFMGHFLARSSPANVGLPSRWAFTPME